MYIEGTRKSNLFQAYDSHTIKEYLSIIVHKSSTEIFERVQFEDKWDPRAKFFSIKAVKNTQILKLISARSFSFFLSLDTVGYFKTFYGQGVHMEKEDKNCPQVVDENKKGSYGDLILLQFAVCAVIVLTIIILKHHNADLYNKVREFYLSQSTNQMEEEMIKHYFSSLVSVLSSGFTQVSDFFKICTDNILRLVAS